MNEGGEFLKFANTITTNQDRNPNAGIIPFNYKKVSYMPRTLLYKMAGNSIVVSVLEEIFNAIEKLNFFIDNDKRI